MSAIIFVSALSCEPFWVKLHVEEADAVEAIITLAKGQSTSQLPPKLFHGPATDLSNQLHIQVAYDATNCTGEENQIFNGIRGDCVIFAMEGKRKKYWRGLTIRELVAVEDLLSHATKDEQFTKIALV